MTRVTQVAQSPMSEHPERQQFGTKAGQPRTAAGQEWGHGDMDTAHLGYPGHGDTAHLGRQGTCSERLGPAPPPGPFLQASALHPT